MGRGPGPDPPDGNPTVPEWMGGNGIFPQQVLSLQAVDGERKLSPFVVGRSMSQLVGEIEHTSTEANGTKYVLRVRDPRQVEKLLAMKELFDGTAVKVEFHPVLNQRRCVVSCREVQDEKDEELLSQLKDQGVIAVRRITRMVEGVRRNTPTLVLTIKGTTIPEHIKFGPLRVKTRTYMPDPMLCYRCYSFGHTKLRCKGEPRCRNCSGSHSMEEECKANPHCHNCKGPHGPSDRSCPTYAFEKEVVRVRVTQDIPHQEAAKKVKAGNGSFASKLQERLSKAQQPDDQQKDELIKALTETIGVLSARIDELERRKKKRGRKNKNKEDPEVAMALPEESGSEMETDCGSTTETTTEPATTATAAVIAAAMAAVAQAKQQEPNKTGTIPKAGAPKASDPSSKVSGQPLQNPYNHKRQHTLTELSLPSKKTNTPNPVTPQNQKQLLPPRPQIKK